jgi:hypothetical protein
MPADIRRRLTKYGNIQAVTEDKWCTVCRYNVENGIRVVTMNLKIHVPSHLYIEGYRALISYIGQPVTCYVCNAADHMAEECPKRIQTRRNDTQHTVRGHKWSKRMSLGQHQSRLIWSNNELIHGGHHFRQRMSDLWSPCTGYGNSVSLILVMTTSERHPRWIQT